MAFIDSLEKGFGSVIKTMLQTLSAPLGCAPLQEAKSPKDEYIDADKICTDLMDRLAFESLNETELSDIATYCRMSCKPEMRAVPIIARTPPPLPSPITTEAVAMNTMPRTEVPLLETASPAPRFDDPKDIIREINAIMSGYHPNPYDDPSAFRENPYGDLEAVDTGGSTPTSSVDGSKNDPYADIAAAPGVPATTVKSSIMPSIQVIWLGAAAATTNAADQKFEYKPFFTEQQRTMCGCFDMRRTDTKLEVQMCIADAKRSE